MKHKRFVAAWLLAVAILTMVCFTEVLAETDIPLEDGTTGAIIVVDNKYERVAEEQLEEPVCYTEEDVVVGAKILFYECGGLTATEQACVMWTICNRVDAGYGPSITFVGTKGHYAYFEDAPVRDDLYAIAKDVLERWNGEKNGETDSGRVLPSDYCWFHGDGKHNYFRNSFDGGTVWDYSIPSPYADEGEAF